MPDNMDQAQLLKLLSEGWRPPTNLLERLLEPDPEAWRPALAAFYDIAGKGVKPSTPFDDMDRKNAAWLAYAFMFAPKAGTEPDLGD